MTPRIVYSELSKRWYIATRYRMKQAINTITGEDVSYIVATTKHDVTDQMQEIFAKNIGRPPAQRSRSARRVTGTK